MVEYVSTNDIEEFYKSRRPCQGAGYLRFILMAFVSFWNFGFPEPTGFISALSGFAVPAFFILSGFFIMPADRDERLEKMKHKIKRTALWFGLLFIAYVIINIPVCIFGHISVVISRRVIFNFIVLNLWFLPIGSCIWFIQAMLYAYILIYIADKLNLLKYYKAVLVASMIFMLFTGEFAGLIHFNVLGYNYIPGNWFTRALPYILLGMLLREKAELFVNLHKLVYAIAFVVGIALVIAEIILLRKVGCLVYEGHMIGYGIMAFAACCIAVSYPSLFSTRISYYDTSLSGLSYSLMEPIYFILAIIAGKLSLGFFSYFCGFAALILSLVIAFVLRNNKFAHLFFSYREAVE